MTRLAVQSLLLVLSSPALAGGLVRCQTHYEVTLNRLMTLCDNGTWAVLNPRTQQIEVRCR